MRCSDFISRFSDYFDGAGEASFLEEAEAHLDSCRSCRRYREVVQRGAEMMRSVPPVRVGSNFYPRLQHRIFHLHDADALTRGSAGSATTAATILGMAVLLAAVAWSPLVRFDEPEVELSPIVVSRPEPPPTIGLRPPPVSFSAAAVGSARRFQEFERSRRDLWEVSQNLLWEYSPLNQGFARPASFRRLD